MKVRISRFKQIFQRSHGTKGHHMIVDLSNHQFFVENHAGKGFEMFPFQLMKKPDIYLLHNPVVEGLIRKHS